MTHPRSKDLFEILVREHAPMLIVYLRSVVSDAAAVDDLFQETMLTAWRTLDRFDRKRPFGPWLRGIAGKLIMAHRRKSADAHLLCDEHVLEHLDGRLAALEQQHGDTFDEKLAALRQCIDAMPDRYREVVRLRYRVELPTEQIAEHLKLTIETVKKRLQRARMRLFDCLSRKLGAAEGLS